MLGAEGFKNRQRMAHHPETSGLKGKIGRASASLRSLHFSLLFQHLMGNASCCKSETSPGVEASVEARPTLDSSLNTLPAVTGGKTDTERLYSILVSPWELFYLCPYWFIFRSTFLEGLKGHPSPKPKTLNPSPNPKPNPRHQACQVRWLETGPGRRLHGGALCAAHHVSDWWGCRDLLGQELNFKLFRVSLFSMDHNV